MNDNDADRAREHGLGAARGCFFAMIALFIVAVVVGFALI